MNMSRQNYKPASSLPYLALAGLVCSVIATGWLRNFGEGQVSVPLVGVFLTVIGVGVAVDLTCRRLGVPWAGQVLAGLWGCGLSGEMALRWIGKMGGYAVPHAPDGIGLALCLAATVTAALSVTRREMATALNITSFALALFVAITSFLYDQLTHVNSGVIIDQ